MARIVNTNTTTIDGVTLDNELNLIDMDQFIRINVDGVIIKGRVAEIRNVRCYDVFKHMTVRGISIFNNVAASYNEITITIK